jgi:hypothetical protein
VARTLLDDIERDVLDEHASLASALRKCVALGGRSGSEALRDWATRELEGYYGTDEPLPNYRVINAPIRLDGISGHMQITGQSVSPWQLPDPVCDHVDEKIELRDGAGALEELAKLDTIKLMLPGGARVAQLMNMENDDPYQRIDSVYWAPAPVAVRGVVDQIRTALTKLVAELRATMPKGEQIPSEEAATQAMQFVVNGKRAKVNFTAAQASGPSSTATTNVTHAAAETESGRWTTWRRVGAASVGIATIAAAVFTALQVF